MKISATNVKRKTGILVVNFGGPRSIDEIPEFLISLLCDQEVLRTPLPKFLHKALFTWIAKKRAKKIKADYQSIGGQSPIFKDTEKVASMLREMGLGPIVTFHRYLPATHPEFIRTISKLDLDQWQVFPMFPQFSYTTSGSIARWLDEKLPMHFRSKINWLKSYPCDPHYVSLFESRIRRWMDENQVSEDELLLFFSAHGLPQKYVDEGDPYQKECILSYEAISKKFPLSASILAYQSKFGPGEWIKPYTIDVCKEIQSRSMGKKKVLFIPLAFTSDHIETLFEIETEYMPVIEEKGLKAYRLPAFNDRKDWVETIAKLLDQPQAHIQNQMLVRKKRCPFFKKNRKKAV